MFLIIYLHIIACKIFLIEQRDSVSGNSLLWWSLPCACIMGAFSPSNCYGYKRYEAPASCDKENKVENMYIQSNNFWLNDGQLCASHT